MSIPTRFNVLTPTNTYKNQSMFTISYGQDLKDRNVWKERFQECFNDMSVENKQRFCPWYFEEDFIIEISPDISFFKKDFHKL
jgi:hypothetical protein